MKEINDIIRAYQEVEKQRRPAVLATVVHVEGSSYRPPGARMLITEEGQLTGAISGGCLEGDALRKALLVLKQERSMLVTYDSMEEEDAKLGVGLGCNGIIQVLMEPLEYGSTCNAMELLKAVAGKRQHSVLVTLFSLQDRRNEQPGTCLFLQEDQVITCGHPIKDIILTDAKKALTNQSSCFKNYVSTEQNLTSFIEYIPPPVSLVVIGAGNDVVPLVAMADILGWQTTVVDGRASYARADRFASSCQVLVSKPERILDELTIDEQTVFVLMTHNYNYDLAMLRLLVQRKPAYVGCLGPQKKLNRMIDELKEEGIQVTEQTLSQIYGPSGLDIGAETPEEIALSILAEIKAALSGRQGQSLRNNLEVIHPRSLTRIEKIMLDP